MRHQGFFTLIASLTLLPLAFADDPDGAFDDELSIHDAVVCESVNGYRDYVQRDPPELTRDEKLLLYYEIDNAAYEKEGGTYRVNLLQDARIYRKGKKNAVWKKDAMARYNGKSEMPPDGIYMMNTIELKRLEPGVYEVEIVLHDKLGGGEPVTERLEFTVIRATQREVPDEDGPRSGTQVDDDGQPLRTDHANR